MKFKKKTKKKLKKKNLRNKQKRFKKHDQNVTHLNLAISFYPRS